MASPGCADGGTPPRATCGGREKPLLSLYSGTPRASDMWSLEMPPRWMNEVSPPRGTYGERASLIGSTTRPVTPLAHDMWRAAVQRGFRPDCHRCARYRGTLQTDAVLLPRRAVSGQGGGRRLRWRQCLPCASCILGQGSSSLVSISFHLNRVARGFVAMRLAISQVSGARHWMLRHGSAPPGTRPDATRKFRLLAWR